MEYADYEPDQPALFIRPVTFLFSNIVYGSFIFKIMVDVCSFIVAFDLALFNHNWLAPSKQGFPLSPAHFSQ